MLLSNNSLLVIIAVGIIAGWAAGNVVMGGGLGLLGDLIVGVIGAFIGDWLMPQLHTHLGVGLVSEIASAAIGAIILLAIIRLLSLGRTWGGGGWWQRRRFGRW